MKLLLTSNGVTNASIRNALTALLGKPIAESNALFVPSGIYPFRGGAYMAMRSIVAESSMCNLGWKSVGLLELTALPSIDKNIWI